MKVLIIGGGASGMMAALSALENPNNTVTLLERQSRVGKKLLATGNGRCNLTNRNIRLSHYHGEQPEFARFALESFYVGRTLAFFERLGLLTVTEDSGKVYPLSDQASSVLDVLRFAAPDRAETMKKLLMEKAEFKGCLIMDTRGVSSMYANDGGVIVTV